MSISKRNPNMLQLLSGEQTQKSIRQVILISINLTFLMSHKLRLLTRKNDR